MNEPLRQNHSSESISNLQCRFNLEEAKFFYERMKDSLDNKTEFLYFLDAFLATARSITHTFQRQFKDAESKLMELYQWKVKEWENNKLMRFFKKMRNISLKEHTPQMQTTMAFGVNCVIESSVRVWRKPPRAEMTEKTAKRDVIVGYSFLHPFKWFDSNPDVMILCKKYLDELEKFVIEVENMIKKEGTSHE